MHTVVEMPSYLNEAVKLFSAAERAAIVDRLAADPNCGVLIRGGNGIRKVRFAFGARGKSGGARVMYVRNMPIFVLAVFAKNEKTNLSAAERNALGKMADILIRNYRSQQ
jgi:hypothetical protein